MMLSKTERILALINFYLPHTDLWQYHYEADTIAQGLRKNSSIKTIERLVREAFAPEELRDELVHALAVGIKGAV